MAAPSDWVQRWADLIAPGGAVLDLACGGGRHVRWLAAQGFRVTGVDRDAEALTPLHEVAEVMVADLEAEGPWPLAGRRFDAVVVTNYLWRPRFADVLSLLADDGVLIYETFAAGNEALGRPARPDFLLQRGELLQRCAGLRVVAYEDGRLENPPRCVQRIAALGPQTRPDRIVGL
ncbi:MAG: class I SAM-dependent methyltransferase [Burkholderiaceae bacterium]|nr:class I SAM-dependent methyltransferase [Burkholderiaceae bacterium]